MKTAAVGYVLTGLAVVLLACAPGGTPGEATHGAPREAARPKTLTLTLDGEPQMLITSLGGAGSDFGTSVRAATHQELTDYDSRGQIQPLLATEVPSQERGTWLVRPDGTMQTTYRLQRGVTWHDGTGLTATDFVFAWTIHRDLELPISDRTVANLIDQIATPDDHTLVVEWSRTYPYAGAIEGDNLSPLARHILWPLYEQDKGLFARSPYFNHEFVGVGPYRLTEWAPGSHLVVTAYDGFYGGRARIDTIVFRIIPHKPTVVANLLAGSIDGMSAGRDFKILLDVQRQWEGAGRRPLIASQPGHWQFMSVQFRPEVVDPREVLDVRFRRGLLHAIDRGALADALYEGAAAPISHTFVPPVGEKWDWVKDAAVRYEYDPRRARELFGQVGLQAGGDGMFSNVSGQRITVPLWSTGSETEINIVGDYWKAAGIAPNQTILGQAQRLDIRLRASYPALDYTSLPTTFETTIRRIHGQQCPGEHSRWVGSNRGCYQNPAADRTIDALRGAIDPGEQRRLYRELVKLQTEELPLLPLFFEVRSWIFREGIVGPKLESSEASLMWNLIEWDVVN